MSLARLQHAFLAEIAGDDETAPSSTGMAIYRKAYRARLLDALAVGYERTRNWVGEDAFDAAGAHYILVHPPSSWTLDAFGADFPETLTELFPDDPEVAELAWLEWQMQQAFAAPDLPELTAADLAAAGLDDEDWADLRLNMAAGFAARPAGYDLAALWHALAAGPVQDFALAVSGPHHLIVWRKALQPHFRLLDSAEWAMLDALAAGTTFGESAALVDNPERLGSWLGQWLIDGLFTDSNLAA